MALSRGAVTVIRGWSQLRPKNTRIYFFGWSRRSKNRTRGKWKGLMGQCQDEGKVLITRLKFKERLVWVPDTQPFIENQNLYWPTEVPPRS